jgi:thiol-disulfide isomerase/thioredoxin
MTHVACFGLFSNQNDRNWTMSAGSESMKALLKIFISVWLLTALVARADEHFDVLKIGIDSYTNVTIWKVTDTDIYFNHSRGMGNAKLKDLSPELQSHFGYNPTNAAVIEHAQSVADLTFRQQLNTAKPPTPATDGSLAAAPDVPEGLEVGQRFPDFNVTDAAGGNFSLTLFKGKVVLIDFWATWCGPCREEMPNIVSLYQTYHPQGFEIIGVSLDTDRDALVNYTQQMGMTWPQCFDGQGPNNQIARKYGINAIPMTYLLDRNGIIIGKSLRGNELNAALEKAFAQ